MEISVPGVTALLNTGGKEINQSSPEVLGTLEETLSLDGTHVGVRKGKLHKTSNGILSAISGAYFWRNRELADHAKRHDEKNTLSFAYEKFGNDLLEHIGGRFSLVVWDAVKKSGVAATDRFGQNTVYWHSSNGLISIAATTVDILRMHGLSPQVSSQAIFHYLFFHMVPSPGTIYDGISKLPAAHAIRLDSNGATPYRYWRPTFSEVAEKRRSQAGEELLHVLQTSVSRLNTGDTTGAFLSGGLDSSTVSGMLAKAQNGAAQTFSIGFDAQGYDEISYARIANRHFNTKANEYYVTPEDVLEILPTVAAVYDEPFGNSSAIPAYFCAKLARESGMDRLLAGDGGDELFAGNERYAKQGVFEAYHMLPSALRQYVLEPLFQGRQNNGLLGKVGSYIDQAQVPLPKRLHTYNFLMRFPADQMFEQQFMANVDLEEPFSLEDRIYHGVPSASRLNRMLYLDWQHTLADNDLRKVNRMCQLAGVEVEYPMLDDLVVEFSTRIPSHQKMPFNKLRDFYKRAVSDFLPHEIIIKSKHGFGLPFGVWMSTHNGLQDLGRKNLSQFRERGIIKPSFVDELLALHDKSHAGYYGGFIWVLVMLELWLDQHGH